MDWTDRHCRALHRTLTRRALLYSEMITADAVIHGDRERLVGFSDIEHPVALQLGGAEAQKLAAAARIGAQFGYDEINLNVGCPSDRVQDGRFGACLMREPGHVAALWSAMQEAAPELAVSVKCRIGIDDQPPEETLFGFVEAVAAAGCRVFIVHARKAILAGLSPRQNREIPPLDYDLVRRLKRARPELSIILNGGLNDVAHALAESQGLDGAMLGRAAYHTPACLLDVDPAAFGQAAPSASREEAVRRFIPYIETQLARGVPLHAMTRHMLGLFHARPGGRLWRRTLSEEGPRRGSGVGAVERALAHVSGPEKLAAAVSFAQ
jgi:tRNA-dihydrouridine synthase A